MPRSLSGRLPRARRAGGLAAPPDSLASAGTGPELYVPGMQQMRGLAMAEGYNLILSFSLWEKGRLRNG
jgi:hypothetical protein